MSKDDQLEELLRVALQYFPDTLDEAVESNNLDLFQKIMDVCNRILVDRSLSNLIERGLVEISGVDDSGDFYFTLTEEGKKISEAM